MHVQRLVITNFKNYESQELVLSRGFNCFFGNNGMGKTNLLDAVYFLCMAKSHFNLPDSALLRKGAEFIRMEGYFEQDGRHEKIVVKSIPRKLKVIERNGVPYERLADHIGLLPVVFIAPDDTELLTEGSEARRRFLDNTLCQMDPRYLQELMLYNRVLQQRNALLKQMAVSGRASQTLLEIYDQQLVLPAQYIFEQRAAFALQFETIFLQFYAAISRQAEQVDIRYKSALHDQSLDVLFLQNFEKDCATHRTNAGIHRDDLDCFIEGMPVKRFASQGQRKSFLLALKLAQYDLIKENKGFKPILLLDDLFDKLDPSRTQQLLELLSTAQFEQVLITDTQASRLSPLLPSLQKESSTFQVEKGKVKP